MHFRPRACRLQRQGSIPKFDRRVQCQLNQPQARSRFVDHVLATVALWKYIKCDIRQKFNIFTSTAAVVQTRKVEIKDGQVLAGVPKFDDRNGWYEAPQKSSKALIGCFFNFGAFFGSSIDGVVK